GTIMDIRLDQINEESRLDSSHTRRSPRLRLQVPVFLRASDATGLEFIELTKTLNISATGACITSSHILRPEQTVHLTIPAPSPTLSSFALKRYTSEHRERKEKTLPGVFWFFLFEIPPPF